MSYQAVSDILHGEVINFLSKKVTQLNSCSEHTQQ